MCAYLKAILTICMQLQGFFLVSSGAEIQPLSQWDLGDFFLNLKKKFPISKKNYFFFFENFHSVTTHTHSQAT